MSSLLSWGGLSLACQTQTMWTIERNHIKSNYDNADDNVVIDVNIDYYYNNNLNKIISIK